MSIELGGVKGLMLEKASECFCDYTKPEKCRACKAVTEQSSRKIWLNREKLAKNIFNRGFKGKDIWENADDFTKIYFYGYADHINSKLSDLIEYVEDK